MFEEPRHQPRADHENQGDEGGDLGDRERQRDAYAVPENGWGKLGRMTFRRSGQRRQQHEHQHHREVLDDEPADRDAAVNLVERVALLQNPQQHNSARHGETETEQQAGNQAPAPEDRHCGACRHRGRDLRERAGHGYRVDLEKILDREVQTDPKHEQYDPDLGELSGETDVGDEARREGADGDAGQQVADQWRQVQPTGYESKAEGKDQAHHDGGDERGRVRHRRLLASRGRQSPPQRNRRFRSAGVEMCR